MFDRRSVLMSGRGSFGWLAVLGCAGAAWAGTPGFTDATEQAFGERPEHRAATFRAKHGYAQMAGGGAVADFDNDGWLDFFYLGGGDQPDQLWINNRDGTFTDNASAWGVDFAHMGIAAAVGDYNGDGWVDVFVTSLGAITGDPEQGRHLLYRNNGDGTFTDVAAQAGVRSSTAFFMDGFGSTFGDYDLDGDLDLFVTGWWPNSGHNRLFRNDGDGTFTDVTEAAGVLEMRMRGFSPAFVDMDGDRYPELLVAGDFGTSYYFVNNGDGTFTNTLQGNGTGVDDNGMGAAIADFDGDGLFDWYVTSVHADQSYEGIPGWEDKTPGTGNMLYLNSGLNQFVEVARGTPLNDGGWGWGTVPVDIDHDGDWDLVETNGWPDPDPFDALAWANDPCYVYENDGAGSFVEIGAACGVTRAIEGRGLINFDYDNDGDQDVLVLTYNDGLVLYRSEVAGQADANWLRVMLETGANETIAPQGLGAKVEITVGGRTAIAPIHAAPHYLSISEVSAHFGLASDTVVDRVRVYWPNGTVTDREDVAANQLLTISAPRVGDVDEDGAVGPSDITEVVRALGSGVHPADADGNGRVDVNDITLVVRRLTP